MLENRSFDHMLGYLSLETTHNPMPVDGLKHDPVWLSRYANPHEGQHYTPRRLSPLDQVLDDPRHGFESIDKQVTTAPRGPGPTKMGGFATNYATPKEAGDPRRDPWVP